MEPVTHTGYYSACRDWDIPLRPTGFGGVAARVRLYQRRSVIGGVPLLTFGHALKCPSDGRRTGGVSVGYSVVLVGDSLRTEQNRDACQGC